MNGFEREAFSNSRVKTYAILGVGTSRVKIGSAGDITKRGKDLQLGSPVELVLIGWCDHNIERRLHAALDSEWVHGEWFRMTSKTRQNIAQTMQPALSSFIADSETIKAFEPNAIGADARGSFGTTEQHEEIKYMGFRQRLKLLKEMRQAELDRASRTRIINALGGMTCLPKATP